VTRPCGFVQTLHRPKGLRLLEGVRHNGHLLFGPEQPAWLARAMNTSFFGELLQSIAERGRALVARNRRAPPRAVSDSLIDRCEALLSGRGEASGTALATDILHDYSELTIGPRIAFFEALAESFGSNRRRLETAIEAWRANPTDAAASEIHFASEPRRLELFRRLNLAPGGTAALLLETLDRRPELMAVNADFVHLFTSWFNRGFLVLRRIDWSTPAAILEKIIRYEAVHKINSWDDLRSRIDPPDRCCFAFFHPALIDEPLIFVEVALTTEIPDAIAPILAPGRAAADPDKATTAVFYSISNCQRGLAGVSFGHFLIKQVVEEMSRDSNKLSTYVTLSPVPDFARWLARERKSESSRALSDADRAALAALDQPQWWQSATARAALHEPLLRAAAWYFLQARTTRGTPPDSVARFHLGNGARLERLNFLGDTSDKALSQSCGLMVNYRYDIDDIEKNHEAYAEGRTVIASSAVKRLVPKAGTELVKAG
jgi:malonyl-CoA decarboxylase